MFETHPPFSRGDFLSGSDYGRDGQVQARSRLGWLRDLPALFNNSPNDSQTKIYGRPRFGIRADSSRFSILSLPPNRVSRRGTIIAIWIFLFRDQFLSELDNGLVSMRRAHYRLVWPFSIPVDSPRNQRGRSSSRNRGLRFKNRAESGRFPLYFSAFPKAPRTRTVQGARKSLNMSAKNLQETLGRKKVESYRV